MTKSKDVDRDRDQRFVRPAYYVAAGIVLGQWTAFALFLALVWWFKARIIIECWWLYD